MVCFEPDTASWGFCVWWCGFHLAWNAVGPWGGILSLEEVGHGEQDMENFSLTSCALPDPDYRWVASYPLLLQLHLSHHNGLRTLNKSHHSSLGLLLAGCLVSAARKVCYYTGPGFCDWMVHMAANHRDTKAWLLESQVCLLVLFRKGLFSSEDLGLLPRKVAESLVLLPMWVKSSKRIRDSRSCR